MKRFLSKFHHWINGAPDGYITAALIIIGILNILAALIMPAEFKAVILAWELFP